MKNKTGEKTVRLRFCPVPCGGRLQPAGKVGQVKFGDNVWYCGRCGRLYAEVSFTIGRQKGTTKAEIGSLLNITYNYAGDDAKKQRPAPFQLWEKVRATETPVRPMKYGKYHVKGAKDITTTYPRMVAGIRLNEDAGLWEIRFLRNNVYYPACMFTRAYPESTR